ncbi:hypothetical protein BKA61DRAFT_683152 [Leptodontidium sp. MPI-SDFR-AT-0119]|nr:hypothetical protein BKA61DRAFT_683152 [Leptodontidium sp. MPI-SDFR-AT-0119]
MQLQSIVAFAFAGILCLTTGGNSECTLTSRTIGDCCWGGKNGRDACQRQLVATPEACDNEESDNYCINNGVTNAQCDADCCAISTGFGIGCPK